MWLSYSLYKGSYAFINRETILEKNTLHAREIVFSLEFSEIRLLHHWCGVRILILGRVDFVHQIELTFDPY